MPGPSVPNPVPAGAGGGCSRQDVLQEREEGESAAWRDIGERVKLCDGLAGASASAA